MSSLLIAELARAARRGRLWGIIVRNAIPVAGVYLLGWPAALALFFYLLEIWLYLSFRASLSLALDDAGNSPALRAVLGSAARHFLLVAPLLGAVLGGIAWFAVRMMADGWSSIKLGVHRWDFAAGIIVLAAMAFAEAWRYLRLRVAGERLAEDDLREMAIVYRTVFLMMAAVSIYFLVPPGYDAQLLVAAVAAASVWIEGAPRHAMRAFGAPRRTRRQILRRMRNA